MPPTVAATAAFARAASRPLLRPATLNATARRAFHRNTQGQGPGARRAWQQYWQQSQRRWQSSTAEGAAQPSWFQRMWNSPIGLKTVHFWAPVMKWALVLAGISDFARPAEKLSVMQNVALTATGLIWTRWCLIIKPKNYLLAAVNFFLGIVGVIQCSRIFLWSRSQKNASLTGAVAEAKEEVKAAVKA